MSQIGMTYYIKRFYTFLYNFKFKNYLLFENM